MQTLYAECMAYTDAQMLELIDAAIDNRFTADLVESYTEAMVNRVKMMDTTELFRLREFYAGRVAATSGATGAAAFFLAEPFDE